MTTITTRNPVVLGPVSELIAGQARATVSAARPVRVRRVTRAATARPAAKYQHATLVSHTFAERMLYLTLSLAALGGIALAVLDVLVRAQNWPIFNAWIGRILGA